MNQPSLACLMVLLVLLAGCVAPEGDAGNESLGEAGTPPPTAGETPSPTPTASPTPTETPTQSPTASRTQTPDAGETHTVEIGKNVQGIAADYAPNTITIAVGDSVVWKNLDSIGHTATADDESFDTKAIPGGTSSEALLFETAGTFTYFCEIHPSTMNGAEVVVKG